MTQGPGLPEVGYAIKTRPYVFFSTKWLGSGFPASVAASASSADRTKATASIVRLQKRRKPSFRKTRGEANAKRDLRESPFRS